ncbi:MAG: hypothetical protein HQM13_06460 [SAR324 cluster bacterium]|nr:hypothetical protein [SAR324 cluster bacterium]
MKAIIQKLSPLDEAYQRNAAHFLAEEGWSIPEHCGNPEKERAQLETGSVLVDWSHIGKITLRGNHAEDSASRLDSRAASLKPQQSCSTDDWAVLRLTGDEFMILCKSGKENAILASVEGDDLSILNHGGGLGCLVLGGKGRDEVIERSSAMNLRRDIVPAGTVVQTSIHMVPCTIFRTSSLEILIHTRDFSESLFDALMDVGHGVGLIPSGVATLPVSFSTGQED